MYQALSCFTILQATGSWGRAWERGYLFPSSLLGTRLATSCISLVLFIILHQSDSNMAICHRDYHSTEKDMYYSTLYILHFTQSISSTTRGWGLGTRLQFTQLISLTPQPPHRFNPLLPLTCSCCTSHSRQPGDRQDTPYIAHLSSAEETPSLREVAPVALGPLDAWFDVLLLLQSIPPLHPHQHLSPCLNL